MVGKLLTKEIHNSTRIFEKFFSQYQFATFKLIISSIIKYKTLTISHLFDENKVHSSKKKFVERVSRLLWKFSFKDTVKKFTLNLINSFFSSSETKIVCYDATDISKPRSKKLPFLSWIYDPSTKQYSQGYIIHWVFVNDFLYNFDIVKPKKVGDSYKVDYSKLNWEVLFREVISTFWKENTIHIFDRFFDDKKFLKVLTNSTEKYIIRWKTNRKVKLSGSNNEILVWELKEWKYNVIVDWVETNLYVVNSAKEWKMLLYSGMESDCENMKRLYLKRWNIEKAFKDSKEFWLEEVKLRDFEKIRNVVFIIQFIYNIIKKVYLKMKRASDWVISIIIRLFGKYIKRFNLTDNFHAFMSFFSQKIYVTNLPNYKSLPKKTLFHMFLFWT